MTQTPGPPYNVALQKERFCLRVRASRAVNIVWGSGGSHENELKIMLMFYIRKALRGKPAESFMKFYESAEMSTAFTQFSSEFSGYRGNRHHFGEEHC